MPSPQVRHFCFTLNNYDEEEYTSVCNYFEAEAKYWIIGKEAGESGTPHLQGYASLKRRSTFNVIRDKLGRRAHIESARGTSRQNREYCSKGGDFAEGGNLSSEGGRPDRDDLAKQFMVALGSGAQGVDEFAHTFPGTYIFSGHNMLRNALSLYTPVCRPGITVRWLYGEPGVGKSRRAHEEIPEAYIKDPRTKWWNGYLMQKDVIIDDFAPLGIDMNHLLRWFDRYKCYVESKGGMLALLACNFIVTSNFHPLDCFKDKEGVPHPQMDALYRRITIEEIKDNT